MAYPPRLFVQDSWYHVISRGQRREPLYFSPLDRIAYLSFLDRELQRRGGSIGSYCLMTNHVHLLIRMGTEDLGSIFKTTHMKYAQYFNQKRDTTGHVFQSRPTMKIVLNDAYLDQLVAYIHKNPVEAGLVDQVEDYEWSSWRWFLREGTQRLACSAYPPGFVSEERAKRFRRLISKELDLPGREHYWGTEEEWDELDRRREGREARKIKERRGRKSKEEIVNEVLDGLNISVDQLKSSTQKEHITAVRREAMGRMYEAGYGPTEIGKWFNRTKGSVNHAYLKWNEERNK